MLIKLLCLQHNWTLTPGKGKLAVTEREKELLRMAAIYASQNLYDVIEAFTNDPDLWDHAKFDSSFTVDGCPMRPPTDEEMSSLLKHLL